MLWKSTGTAFEHLRSTRKEGIVHASNDVHEKRVFVSSLGRSECRPD